MKNYIDKIIDLSENEKYSEALIDEIISLPLIIPYNKKATNKS